jgi:hypothetical protein
MKPSARSGVALTITALSLVVTLGAGASGSIIPVDENWLGRGPAVPQRVAEEKAAAAGSITRGDEIWLGRGPGIPQRGAGF